MGWTADCIGVISVDDHDYFVATYAGRVISPNYFWSYVLFMNSTVTDILIVKIKGAG